MMPATNMMPTSNMELLMAKVPTTQNSKIKGMSTSRGTSKIRLATLMHKMPSGIMMMLAMMNNKNTA